MLKGHTMNDPYKQIIDNDYYTTEAERLGIRFEGILRDKNVSLAMFTDVNGNQSTFCLASGESVEPAFLRHRKAGNEASAN